MDDFDRLVRAVRRIIRVTDLNAKRLASETGLTPTQFIVLQLVQGEPGVSPGSLAREINLKQATVTTIVDQLEASGLVTRNRSEKDRRIVQITMTKAGATLLESAPAALHDTLRSRHTQLEDWEKSFLIAALDRLAVLLEAEGLEASPVLETGILEVEDPGQVDDPISTA